MVEHIDHFEIEVQLVDVDGVELGVFWLDGEKHPIKPGQTLKVIQSRPADKDRGFLD